MMTTKNKKPSGEKRNLARGINSVLSGKFLTREYVQANLTFIFFVVGVMICYIGYGYFAEKNAKDLVKAESRLRETKAANLAVRARLEKLKQQSQVAQSIKDLGLVESTAPPHIIRVPKSEIQTEE